MQVNTKVQHPEKVKISRVLFIPFIPASAYDWWFMILIFSND